MLDCRRNGINGVLLALGLTLSAAAASAEPVAEAKWIDAVRELSVQKLDASLPDTSLQTWLAEIAAEPGAIRWNVNACGEQTGDPARDKGRDFPACVSTSFAIDEESDAVVRFIVGTFERGMTGNPEVHGLYLERPSGTKVVESLAELQKVITRQ